MMRLVALCILLSFLLATPQRALAEDAIGPPGFEGFNFGVGLGANFDIGKHNRVKSASVVNGIVRIESQEDVSAGIVFESHLFFTSGDVANLVGGVGCETRCGVGPFVAIQADADKIVKTIAFGVMMGIKANQDKESKSSFNLGLGVAISPQQKILGDGIEKNKPLPVGETTVRLKEQEQIGLLLLFSTSF